MIKSAKEIMENSSNHAYWTKIGSRYHPLNGGSGKF